MPPAKTLLGAQLVEEFAEALRSAQGEVARLDSWEALADFARGLDPEPVARHGLPLASSPWQINVAQADIVRTREFV